MRKLYLFTLMPGALVFLAGVTGQIAGPTVRTRAYFGLKRQWSAHWPMEHGKYLPGVLQPAAEPFVPVWMQLEPHISMLLDPQDMLSRTLLETGYWESSTWNVIRHHLSVGSTFVDIGAHIGYYSLKAGTVVGAHGRVVAIEPNPETLKMLRGNIEASGANMVSVQPVACSDHEDTLELFAAPRTNTGETSLSKANASQVGASSVSYRVPARPLDAILKTSGIERVDVVKIDVEGAEFLVLKGAVDTLSRFHPVLVIEVIDRQLRELGSSAAELTAFLSSHGYQARGQFEDNIEFVPTFVAAAN